MKVKRVLFISSFLSAFVSTKGQTPLPGTDVRIQPNSLYAHATLIDKKGSMAMPGVYWDLQHFHGDLFIGAKERNQKKHSSENFVLIDARQKKELGEFESLRRLDKVVLFKDKNDRTGFLDSTGRLVAYYESAHGNPGEALFTYSIKSSNEARRGFLNKFGLPVTEAVYEEVRSPKEGYAIAKKAGKYLFIDSTGREIIAPKYAELFGFSKGLAVFTHKKEFEKRKREWVYDKWGVVNTKGEELLPPEIEELQYGYSFVFTDGFATVKRNGAWVKISPTDFSGTVKMGAEPFTNDTKGTKLYGYRVPGGDVVIKPVYHYAGYFKDGVAVVGMEDKAAMKDRPAYKGKVLNFGLINTEGKLIVPLQYHEINATPDGKWMVGVEDGQDAYGVTKLKRGLLDHNGKVLLPAIYKNLGEWSEGLMVADKDGKFGYIDSTGKWVVEPMFLVAYPFSEGLALVTTAEKKGIYINKQGKQAFEGSYVSGSRFKNGKAHVWTVMNQYKRADGKLTIDASGKVLIRHPMNKPPEMRTEWVKCSQCNGDGGRYETVQRTGSSTAVDNYNANVPGGKVITTTTKTWNETKRVGDCFRCGGKRTEARKYEFFPE